MNYYLYWGGIMLLLAALTMAVHLRGWISVRLASFLVTCFALAWIGAWVCAFILMMRV